MAQTAEQTRREAELVAKQTAHEKSSSNPALTVAEKTELSELEETV